MANQVSFSGAQVSASGGPLAAVTSATVATTLATAVNATPGSGSNLAIALGVGTYIFRAVLPHTSANNSTGVMVTAAFSGTSTAFCLSRKDVSGTGDGSTTTTLGTLLGQTGAGPGTSVPRTMLLEGVITVSVAGTLQLQLASGVAAATVTLLANCSLIAFSAG